MLTFEHFPPRSAGNKGTHRVVPGEMVIDGNGPSSPEWEHLPQVQGGIGAHVFCADCNNRVLSPYAKEFGYLSQDFATALFDAGFTRPDPHGVQQLDVGFSCRPGAIARAVVSQMLAGTDTPLGQQHAAVLRWLLTPQSAAGLGPATLFMALSADAQPAPPYRAPLR